MPDGFSDDQENTLKTDENSRIEIAIKIFSTSILVFKNRSGYIKGDRRFGKNYKGVSNHRKLVKLWCEKEFRNIKRIYLSGLNIPCP